MMAWEKRGQPLKGQQGKGKKSLFPEKGCFGIRGQKNYLVGKHLAWTRSKKAARTGGNGANNSTRKMDK